MGLPTKFDADRRLAFLRALSLTGQLNKSATAVGVSPSTVRKLQKADPDFADAYQEALDEYREWVEREVVRRAVEGWDEPVFQKGEQVGEVRKHSDALLMMLMKKLDPAYKEKHQVDVNIGGGILAVPAAESVDEWERRHRVEDAEYEDVPTSEEEQNEPDTE